MSELTDVIQHNFMPRKRGNFKLRAPNREIWNACITPGDEAAAWQDALDFIALVKPEKLAGFRIQINTKPASKQNEAHGGGAGKRKGE